MKKSSCWGLRVIKTIFIYKIINMLSLVLKHWCHVPIDCRGKRVFLSGTLIFIFSNPCARPMAMKCYLQENLSFGFYHKSRVYQNSGTYFEKKCTQRRDRNLFSLQDCISLRVIERMFPFFLSNFTRVYIVRGNFYNRFNSKVKFFISRLDNPDLKL